MSQSNGQHPASHVIGEWTFHPARNELARGGERRQLEERAARTLEHLLRKKGEPASKEELIAAVWEGRSLSDHTVAVVISDLRKALDDDAKRPRYIETVAKRGYRLLANGEARAASNTSRPPGTGFSLRSPWMKAGLAAVAALLVAGAALAVSWGPPAAGTIITVNNIKNETGEARFDTIAAAANEFSADFIGRADKSVLIRDFWDEDSWDPRRFAVSQFGRNARIYHLSGKVVIDGADPYLSLTVADGRDWSTIWTATLPVENGEVAAPLRASIEEMLAKIETRD